MKTTIALYEYTSPNMKGITTIFEKKEEKYRRENVVRISEYVDVDLPPRAREEIIPLQIAALDEQITELNKRAGLALAELERRKGELLALTDSREVS